VQQHGKRGARRRVEVGGRFCQATVPEDLGLSRMTMYSSVDSRMFKVALIVHLSLRTAPLQRLVLFDRTPSLALRTTCTPAYSAPCRESLLART
jgi:hypothetical protein